MGNVRVTGKGEAVQRALFNGNLKDEPGVLQNKRI